MGILMHYYYLLLPLILLPLSLYFVFFIRKRGSGGHLPPGCNGWPILGENVELALLGYQQLVRERMKKYSSVAFRSSLFGEKVVVLCGKEGNKFVFTNDNKLVVPWFPLSIKKAMFPDFDQSRHDHTPKAIFHKLKHDALNPEALKQYLPLMDTLARAHLHDNWRPNSVVKALPSITMYASKLACRVFMNVVDPELVARLLEPFSLLNEGRLALPINFPGTPFSCALRAGRVVRAQMMRIVKERREELNCIEGDDLLTKMLQLAINEDGECMSDNMVVNMVLSFLIAAQFEVSSVITIVVNHLAQLPHIYDRVFKEQMEIAKSKGSGELLTWEDIEKMRYTWNVVRESFRLTPPSMGGFREAAAEFTYAGFTIPKGWKITWTAHSSHSDPDNFPEPEKFDPSRFEGSGPAPYTFVPFGGGTRMCPGRGYVKLVMLVFIHNLVTRFGFEKAIPNEKMLFHRNSPTPVHGLPLHIHLH